MDLDTCWCELSIDISKTDSQCIIIWCFWYSLSPVLTLPCLQLPRPRCSWGRSDCHGLPKLVDFLHFMCLQILVGNIIVRKQNTLLSLESPRRNPSRHLCVDSWAVSFSVFVKWNTGSTLQPLTIKQGVTSVCAMWKIWFFIYICSFSLETFSKIAGCK
jgi:hypothetical protein